MDVQSQVINTVVEQLGVDRGEVNVNSHFVNDLGADSLDTVELVMAFEEQFKVNIPDADAEKIQTVGQAIKYVEDHKN